MKSDNNQADQKGKIVAVKKDTSKDTKEDSVIKIPTEKKNLAPLAGPFQEQEEEQIVVKKTAGNEGTKIMIEKPPTNIAPLAGNFGDDNLENKKVIVSDKSKDDNKDEKKKDSNEIGSEKKGEKQTNQIEENKEKTKKSGEGVMVMNNIDGDKKKYAYPEGNDKKSCAKCEKDTEKCNCDGSKAENKSMMGNRSNVGSKDKSTTDYSKKEVSSTKNKDKTETKDSDNMKKGSSSPHDMSKGLESHKEGPKTPKSEDKTKEDDKGPLKKAGMATAGIIAAGAAAVGINAANNKSEDKKEKDNKSTKSMHESHKGLESHKDESKTTRSEDKNKEENKQEKENKTAKSIHESHKEEDKNKSTGNKDSLSDKKNEKTESENKNGNLKTAGAATTGAVAGGAAVFGINSANNKSNEQNKTQSEHKVKIDENKTTNKRFSNRNSGGFVPDKIENPPSESILHELRKKNAIMAEGMAYKKRMFFFCFWVEQYFVLLKTGELIWIESDGTGTGSGNWDIKHATAFNKLFYDGYTNPYRFTCSAEGTTVYLAFETEVERNYWFDTLQDMSRG